jgi:thiol-disulfide isomerase/thioredoxin
LLKNWRSLQIKKLILFLSIICLSLSFLYGSAVTEINQIYKPERFPDLTFENTLSKDKQSYLGISRKNFFFFKEIKGSLIIVELTSTYCVKCKENIPILNEIYQRIQKDSKLKGKVKVMGIAIGNNRKEVEIFKNEYKILYPLVTDYDFSSHKALGEPRVPYTMFIKKDVMGKIFVINIHKGVIESADSLMNEIRIICSKHFQKYAF